MHFNRTISVKHHRTGDHYSVSIPGPVAEALNLHEDGGLVSIELAYKSYNYKKGVRANAVLTAYPASPQPWRQAFNLDVWTDPGASTFKPVAFPPHRRGPSRPTACGKVIDLRSAPRESRLALQYLRTALKMLKSRGFPRGYTRGPKRRRRY